MEEPKPPYANRLRPVHNSTLPEENFPDYRSGSAQVRDKEPNHVLSVQPPVRHSASRSGILLRHGRHPPTLSARQKSECLPSAIPSHYPRASRKVKSIHWKISRFSPYSYCSYPFCRTFLFLRPYGADRHAIHLRPPPAVRASAKLPKRILLHVSSRAGNDTPVNHDR